MKSYGKFFKEKVVFNLENTKIFRFRYFGHTVKQKGK